MSCAATTGRCRSNQATVLASPSSRVVLGRHAFSGEADPTSARPPLMAAWKRETNGAFTQTVLPGGHFFIDDTLSDLVLAIRHDLDRLSAEK
ncbi:hypothetical protein [Streptomyces sp. SM13]|uniref:hypothetical protein n=1 Tax=Streptomyces sp. SM13 TaxID=1983803 RepID=UPI000CD4EB1D|nr:hypothetical protein [Streptomyces sp. SM13]